MTQMTNKSISVKTPAGKKHQMTQPGWDGTFTGIPIPAPSTTDGEGLGTQIQGGINPSFPGFTGPNE
jgi:hypothetical protein